MKLCKNLRWKAFYDARWPDVQALVEAHVVNDAPYTCLMTCQPMGPDGDLAAPELCAEDRPCFVLSPKQPRRQVS